MSASRDGRAWWKISSTAEYWRFSLGNMEDEMGHYIAPPVNLIHIVLPCGVMPPGTLEQGVNGCS